MLRVLTAGESHGPELVAIMEGLPSGVPISRAAIQADLARRKLGYGRGARMKFEQDELAISGGVRHGESLGGPIAVRIGNTEWPKWQEVMSPEPVDPAVLGRGRGAPLTRPRPGHADLGVAASEALMRRATLLDVAYSPWPTALAAQWFAAGGTVVHGLEMLLHQALLQVRIFVNGDPGEPVAREDEVLRAMRAALG